MAPSSVSAISRKCAGIQASAAGGPLDPWPDVVGAADPDARPLLEQGAGLVGLVEAAGDEDRVRLRGQRLRQPAARRERGVGSEPLADERELEQRDRPGVHLSRPGARPRRCPARLTDGLDASERRYGQRRPRLARVRDADPRPGC